MDVGWSSRLAVLNWTRWSDGRRLVLTAGSVELDAVERWTSVELDAVERWTSAGPHSWQC